MITTSPRRRPLLVAAFLATFLPALVNAGEVTKVDGFTVRYEAVASPKSDWEDPSAAADWLARFKGKIESSHPISYRKKRLEPGKHDVWVEKGKDEWYFLVIGNQADPEKTRLRAQFKLYPREAGVEKLAFNLKLVRKATKLKFSLLSGKTEGHGNLKIVKPETPKSV